MYLTYLLVSEVLPFSVLQHLLVLIEDQLALLGLLERLAEGQVPVLVQLVLVVELLVERLRGLPQVCLDNIADAANFQRAIHNLEKEDGFVLKVLLKAFYKSSMIRFVLVIELLAQRLRGLPQVCLDHVPDAAYF